MTLKHLERPSQHGVEFARVRRIAPIVRIECRGLPAIPDVVAEQLPMIHLGDDGHIAFVRQDDRLMISFSKTTRFAGLPWHGHGLCDASSMSAGTDFQSLSDRRRPNRQGAEGVSPSSGTRSFVFAVDSRPKER